MCCKQYGHDIKECPRDPNIKTRESITEGMDRINQLKDYRKIFSDTMVTTTHFLKKCVKVPKIDPNTITPHITAITR